MQSTVSQSFKAVPIPAHWEKKESVFTGDDLIDAYLKGKEEGRGEMIQILTKQFRDNMKIATDAAEKLYDAAAQMKIKLQAIHLKADGITHFSALFVADEKDFLSDDFRNVFIAARKLKGEVESESFDISFTFMPYSEHLSEKCLNADGFFLKYDKRSRTPKSRPT